MGSVCTFCRTFSVECWVTESSQLSSSKIVARTFTSLPSHCILEASTLHRLQLKLPSVAEKQKIIMWVCREKNSSCRSSAIYIYTRVSHGYEHTDTPTVTMHILCPCQWEADVHTNSYIYLSQAVPTSPE